MSRKPPPLDWLEAEEVVYFNAATTAIVQEARKRGRRKARGRAYITDRRVVVRRGKEAFVEVPRNQLTAVRAVQALRTASAYYTPLPGRRVLRLVAPLEGREMIIGIVLRAAEARAWQDELTPDLANNFL